MRKRFFPEKTGWHSLSVGVQGHLMNAKAANRSLSFDTDSLLPVLSRDLLFSVPAPNKGQMLQGLQIPNNRDPRHVLLLAAHFVKPLIPEATLAAESMTHDSWMSASSLTGFKSGNAIALAWVVFIGCCQNSCSLATWSGAPGKQDHKPCCSGPGFCGSQEQFSFLQ